MINPYMTIDVDALFNRALQSVQNELDSRTDQLKSLHARHERLRKAAVELLDGAMFETGHELIAALRAALAEDAKP
jgi:hypothetical protein